SWQTCEEEEQRSCKCLLVPQDARILPVSSSPLPNHNLRRGSLDKTASLGGCCSFCRMRVRFFSSKVGENCQRVLAADFVDVLRGLALRSISSNRLHCRPTRKTVEPFIPPSSVGAEHSTHPAACKRASRIPTHWRLKPNFRASVPCASVS